MEAVEQSQHLKRLREKAARYRAIARALADSETANQIFKLTEELEKQVREIERTHSAAYRPSPIGPMVRDGT
jgi:hypothetical protein